MLKWPPPFAKHSETARTNSRWQSRVYNPPLKRAEPWRPIHYPLRTHLPPPTSKWLLVGVASLALAALTIFPYTLFMSPRGKP